MKFFSPNMLELVKGNKRSKILFKNWPEKNRPNKSFELKSKESHQKSHLKNDPLNRSCECSECGTRACKDTTT